MKSCLIEKGDCMTKGNTQAGQTTAPRAVGTTKQSEVCSMGQKGWLKGPFGMAVCCGGPLLLLAAISFFGLSLGAIASGALSLASLLACPVGMYLMMRMMTKQNAGKAQNGDN
jgi:hypothetical protein